jgi:hypothetical protein
MVSGEYGHFGCAHDCKILFVVMVEAKNVENSMDNQQSNLIVESACVSGELFLRNCWTHQNVSEKSRHVVMIRVWARRPARECTGTLSFSNFYSVKRKRKNIRGARLPHVFSIEIGDGFFINKEQGQLASTFYPLREKSINRETTPSLEFYRDGILFV